MLLGSKGLKSTTRLWLRRFRAVIFQALLPKNLA